MSSPLAPEPRPGTPLVGVVHLAALPGSPLNTLRFEQIRERALADAASYELGGTAALILENFGDVPYAKGSVAPHVVAAITTIVDRLKSLTNLPIGVNLLRNDARAALGVAAATGAQFIRVNVHTGAMVTDQGIIEGEAHQTLRYRQFLGATTEIWADVHVKHGAPLGSETIKQAAEDAVLRGLADAVIVSGSGTGHATDPRDVRRVRAQLPETRIFIGSGVSPETIPTLYPFASGFIVGTWAKEDGDVRRPVDPQRVARLIEAIRIAGSAHSG